MRDLTFLSVIIKRLVVVIVFWPFINDLLVSIFSGSLLNNLMKISFPFLSEDVASLLVIVASMLALVTLIAPNYGLYVVTSVTTLLARAPDIISLSLVILGLMSLLLVDTYSVSANHKRNVKVYVEGSRIHYLIIFTIFAVTIVLTTYFTTLYLNLFTSFMSSVPAASAVKVFSLFLSVNPVGRALLILVAVPTFMKLSLSFVDAVAHFIIPNSTLAKSELSSAVRYDVEIKYPFYTLMSLIFTLYMAPPLYYVLNYLTTEVIPWSSTLLGGIVRSLPYATPLPILAEVLFFLILWGFLSYATRFFRGYINNKLVAVFFFLAAFFLLVTYLGSLDMSEFLSTVYFKYYRDFLLVGELLLQVTGFVP